MRTVQSGKPHSEAMVRCKGLLSRTKLVLSRRARPYAPTELTFGRACVSMIDPLACCACLPSAPPGQALNNDFRHRLRKDGAWEPNRAV